MTRRKIIFLVPDISAQITTVAAHFAELLSDDFETLVVGPDLGGGVSGLHRHYSSLRPLSEPYIYRLPEFIPAIRRIAGMLATADLVVACKAYLDTVLPSLMARRRYGIPVVVYLDELDSAVLADCGPLKRILMWLKEFHHPLNDPYFLLGERLVRRADRVVCSGRALASHFEGEVIYFGVDTSVFRPFPEPVVRNLRREYGLEEYRCVVFAGAVRPHKGVDEILAAIRMSGRQDLRLVVLGPETDYLGELLAGEFRNIIQYLGPQPRQKIPEFLSLADLIVLPLQDSALGRSQVPCKVFEAMAMGKPIIASAVSDLPEILAGCGVVVPPNDIVAMARGMSELLENPRRAADLGNAARRKCEEYYSARKSREQWRTLIESLLNR